MQLDRTTIAVRERGLLDTLDLALHVTRAFAKPLLWTMASGAVPLMAVDYLLFGWMARMAEHEGEFPFRFVYHLTIQVFLQAPLASVFATAFLGDAVFETQPRVRTAFRRVRQVWPRLAFCQLLLRGVGAGWLLLLALERGREFDFLLEGFVMFLLIAYAAALRSFRPFLNEIILLELNPLVLRNRPGKTVGQRSADLHNFNAADWLFRWVGASLVGSMLTLACYGCCLFVSGVFLNDWSQSWWMVRICLPLSMWLVVTYLTVFRFLSYLDLRIRQEGWEVGLRLQAEASKLQVRENG
jgi:hypothetical protein